MFSYFSVSDKLYLELYFYFFRKDEKKSRTDEEKFSARNKTSKLDTDSQVTSNSLIARDLEDTLVVHSTAWGKNTHCFSIFLLCSRIAFLNRTLLKKFPVICTFERHFFEEIQMKLHYIFRSLLHEGYK